MNTTSLAVPARNNKFMLANSHLPPSPSTSSSYSSLGKNKAQQIPAQKKYGSLGTCTPYSETLKSERPLTPSQTTIGQSDDDESLYLQWTHQLLRERGFTPSPCRPELEDDEETKYDYLSKSVNNKGSSMDDSDDSSVSDMSFSSDDEEEEEEQDIDHYIAEQRRLLMASPSPSSALYISSRQPSMISGYTTNSAMTDVERDVEPSSDTTQTYSNRDTQNPISNFFRHLFSCCL